MKIIVTALLSTHVHNKYYSRRLKDSQRHTWYTDSNKLVLSLTDKQMECIVVILLGHERADG